jgi:hypothetical protein
MPNDKMLSYRAVPIIQRALGQNELLELLLTRQPELEEDAEPFFWAAEISSNRLDAYFSRMDVSTLSNFARDAKDGVSFLDSHDSRKLGFGQSLSGTFETGGDVSRVLADFFTVPGINFGGQHSYRSTDDFIRAVKAGLARDVSVGFYDGRELCDICGDPIWGWTDCPHWPGTEYSIDEEDKETVLATSTIFDAHLAEVSAVFDGATTEAMIIKAQRELEAEYARQLEKRYRAKFPGVEPSWPGIDITAKRSEHKMSKLDNSLEQQLRELLAETPEEQKGLNIVETVTWLAREVERLAPVEQDLIEANERIKELEPQAQDGEQYRNDLIEAALEEGVRAVGTEFAGETYREILGSSSIEVIKQMQADWQAAGDRRFSGGRKVRDGNGETENQVSLVPDEAYAV